MARVFIDGFETGNMAHWDTSLLNANAGVVSNNFNFPAGSYCFHTYSGWAKLAVTAANSYYVAMKLMLKSNDISQGFLRFMNGSTVLGVLRIDNDNNYHHIKMYRGNQANLIATGATSTPFGTSPYTPFTVEVFYEPSTTSGSFVVKINGVIDANLNITGAQTSNDSLQIDSIQIGSWGGDCTYIDDVVVDDSEWPGVTQIQALTPNGAGSNTTWTASAGSNYQCVDEVPYSDSDYVYVNSNDQVDTYALSNLTGTVGSIKSVQVTSRVNIAGSPTPTKVANAIRSGSTNYAGSDSATLTTSWIWLRSLWQNDPNTSNPWSTTNVNALEAGVKSRA